MQALDLGADDYITKPFGTEELLARMRAVLRHQLQVHGERPIFHAGDLSVDLVRRIVKVAGKEVKLSPKEYDLLRVLVQQAGKVLTHKFLLGLHDKRRVLQDDRAALVLNVEEDIVFNALLKREELGSTGVGSGVAIPHVRLEQVKKPFAILVRLREPIDFNSVDG